MPNGKRRNPLWEEKRPQEAVEEVAGEFLKAEEELRYGMMPPTSEALPFLSAFGEKPEQMPPTVPPEEEKLSFLEELAGIALPPALKGLEFLLKGMEETFTMAGATLTVPWRTKELGELAREYPVVSPYPGGRGYQQYKVWEEGKKDPSIPTPFPTWEQWGALLKPIIKNDSALRAMGIEPEKWKEPEKFEFARMGLAELAEFAPLMFLGIGRVGKGVLEEAGELMARRLAQGKPAEEATRWAFARLAKKGRLPKFTLPTTEKVEALTKAELTREIEKGGHRLVDLPTYEEMVWDITKRFAGKGEKLTEKPIIKQLVSLIKPELVARSPVKQLKILQGRLRDVAEGATDLALRPVRVLKKPKVKAGIIVDARIKPKPDAPMVEGKPSMHIHDVVEYAERYTMPKGLRAYFDEIRNVSRQTTVMLEKELAKFDIKLKKLAGESDWVYLHRVVKSVGEVENLRMAGWRSMQKPRSLELAGVGEKLPKPVKYLDDPIAELQYQIEGAYNWIIELRVKEGLKRITTTAKERVKPEIIDDLVNKNSVRIATDHLKKLISRAKRGEQLPTVSLNAVDRKFPEMGVTLRELVGMPSSAQKTRSLNKLSKQADGVLNVAKEEFWNAKSVYQRALREAGATIEEGTSRYFGGRIFTTQQLIHPKKGVKYAFDAKNFRFAPKVAEGKAILGRDLALEVDKQFGYRVPGVFERIAEKLGTFGGVLRETKASVDLSVQFIQTQLGGLGLDVWNLFTGRPSANWIKGAARGVQAAFMPNSYAKWAGKPEVIASLQEGIRHRLLVQASEYSEALGVLAPLLRKTVIGKPAAFIYTRANAAFTAGRVSTATYMWLGERQLATKGLAGKELAHRLDELGQWINKSTGVLSTRGMGVSSTQRSLEAVFMFAPRYTRAVIASVTDITRGSYTGSQAREALTGLITAGISFFTFVPMAVGQTPRLNPLPESLGGDGAKWLTIKVGNSYVGVGGTIYGLARLLANNWAVLTERPEDLFRLDMTNPNVRFIRAKLGPPASLTIDYVTGKGYLGNLTTENWHQVMGTTLDWLLPIWTEALIGDEWYEHLAEKEPLETHPEAALPEIFGMRTIPVTDYDRYMTLRDTYARRDIGVPYREIEDQADRDALFRNHPDLEELQKTTQLDFEKRGNTFQRWYAENTRRINEERNEKMEVVANALLNDEITKQEYDNQRGYIRPFYSGYKSALWDAREKFDERTIKTIEKYVEEQSANDKALDRYQEIRNTPDVDPKTGMPDWDKVNKALENFVTTLPASVGEYVSTHKDDFIFNYSDNTQKIERMRMAGIEDGSWWTDYRELRSEWRAPQRKRGRKNPLMQ